MATYKPYKKTESGKEEIKIPYSVLSNPPNLSVYAKLAGGNTFSGVQVINGSISINGKTVLTDASAFATSAQGTKADNAMPKSGGTFTGPVSSKSYYKSENADLRTSTTLSHIAVNVDNGRTNSHTAYMNGQINIKSASSSSEKTITIPDKAGTIALTSDIPTFTLSGTTLTITTN